jgi:hypothetical protein
MDSGVCCYDEVCLCLCGNVDTSEAIVPPPRDTRVDTEQVWSDTGRGKRTD